MLSDPSTFGGGAKIRLESSIKMFKPPFVYRYRNKNVVPGSLKYDAVKDTWVQGPRMIRPVGRYVAVLGSRD